MSLATYTLFLLDARRQTFWEKLDDYVYYIKAFGNSVEFCFGIFLFFNGAWILLFESGMHYLIAKGCTSINTLDATFCEKLFPNH